jgi:Family of unknown function (DUF5678)
MIEQELDQQELAFVQELQKYVNKWVAILNYGSENETIVASGTTIREARQEAETKGFAEDVFFFKVPSGERVFVPSVNTSAI